MKPIALPPLVAAFAFLTLSSGMAQTAECPKVELPSAARVLSDIYGEPTSEQRIRIISPLDGLGRVVTVIRKI